MNLTEEQLDIVEEMAYRLFTPELIAINLGTPELEFAESIRNPTPERIAFYKGVIRQEMEVREALIKAAQNGSNPALTELLNLLKHQRNSL